MRVITQKEILQNESIEILTMEESKKLCETLPVLKELDVYADTHTETLYKYFADKYFKSVLETGEKNLDTICHYKPKKFGVNDFYFIFNKSALYILVNDIPILKSVGKLHDLLKYDDCPMEFREETNLVSNKKYRTISLPYKELTKNYIAKYKKVNYSNKELNCAIGKNTYWPNAKNEKMIINKFYKHCEKLQPGSTTELVGVLEKNPSANIKNTIGVKESALFDINFPHFKNAENFVEILRIDEADLIVGEQGILQLFVNPMNCWNHRVEWSEEQYYIWHFTPQERVNKMQKVTALTEIFLDVQDELHSSMVLPFSIKKKKKPYRRLFMQSPLEQAQAISSFIEPNETDRAVYQEHYNMVSTPYYKSLNIFAKYNVQDLLEDYEEYEEENAEKTIIYFSDSFSTQSYCYQSKENEKFLLSIQSGKAYIKKEDKYLYALYFGDVGSVTFAMDEKIFNDHKYIKITEFNAGCH